MVLLVIIKSNKEVVRKSSFWKIKICFVFESDVWNLFGVFGNSRRAKNEVQTEKFIPLYFYQTVLLGSKIISNKKNCIIEIL